ncbi:hypothetical protein Tco_0786385 [Tanacetum coccineum]
MFVIISDSDDEITTLPVRSAPSSSDRIPALFGYPLDSGDESSDEDLSGTAKSLHTQTALTSVVHSPPTRPLPTSHAFARRPGKEIPMPLGYRAAMIRWRATPLSTWYPLLPSELPSSSSPPPSLLSSSSLPSPSLLPPSSCKRLRSPSASPPPSVSPSPLPLPPLLSPPPAVLPPSPEVVIPETSATTAPVRLCRMVEAYRWNFARDGIDTWRRQEGDPRYEIGESSSARIHLITSQPIHRTIPLLVARLIRHDGQIMKIYDHQREISVMRVEALEEEVEIWRDRAETAEQRAEDLHETLERTRDEVHEHQVRHEDIEARMQQYETDMRELRAHIRGLSN